MEENLVDIKSMIENVTNDVRRNLKYIHSISAVDDFKTYFEDMVLYEAIGTAGAVRAEADSKSSTLNIATALIASKINPKGYLDRKERIGEYVAYHNHDNLMYAKRKVRDNQFAYLDYKDFGRRTAEVYEEVLSHKEIVDPAELIKIGVCARDLVSGYVEEYSTTLPGYLTQVRDMWKTEKAKYVKEGLTEKPYYKMLCEVYEKNPQHHYPLVTKKALESIASFTYKLDNDLNVSVSDLQDTYRFNDASKLVDLDVSETYSNEIKSVMREYVKRNKKKNKQKSM